MNNKLTKGKYNTLQLLRGIAAIAVVTFHEFGSSGLFKLGQHGVDLFFVLSGFIILYIHNADIGDKRAVLPFFIKRLTRIFPIYWLITFAYVALVTIFSHNVISLDYIIHSLLLLPQEKDPIIGVAWTLEYETLFYLIFCILLFSRKIFYPIMGVWSLAIIFFFVFPVNFPIFVGRIFNPLNLEFLFGCSIALVVLKNKINFKWTIHFSIILIILSAVLQYYNILNMHRFIMWGIPFTVLILGLVKLELKKQVYVPKTLIYLGDASYSIYLTHLVTLLIVESSLKRLNLYEQYGHNGLVQLSFSVAAILVGCIFYSIVEKPLLKYTKSLFAKNSGGKLQRNPYAIDLD
jgi:exopolysaccharide production protein ExoZ